MRKILAVLAVLAMGGCTAVRESVDSAVDTVFNPPSEIVTGLQKIVEWMVWLVVNFFTDVASKIGL
jgi:hypothetical protein